MTNHVQKFFTLSVFLFFTMTPMLSRGAAPLIRMKAGFSSLTVTAGTEVEQESLSSMVTLQPSVLWAIPEFSGRLGVHYLLELGGPFGMTTLSGMGVSGYYHFNGISTSYSVQEDGNTFITKSIPGPFIFASVTPANLNLNRFNEDNNSGNFHTSIFIYDLSAGAGYDYPITQNLLMSAELVLRNGTGASSGTKEANYSGFTFYLSFATTYF